MPPIVLRVVGTLLSLIGLVWIFQGIGVLPGSFMSGQMQWAVNGGIALVVGLGCLAWSRRQP